jgi:activator of 2-hydroxyglutaryl-CoA dehydratase
VAVIGGGALDIGLVRSIEEKLQMKVLVPQNPRIIATLGAALIARDSSIKTTLNPI